MTPQAAGRLGLAASAASFALTFAVAVAGPSLLEPALPGSGGQPPWSLAGHPSPYLMAVLTAAAVACGTAGLALTIWASRRGWAVTPAAVLVAGLVAAAALALVPPFGSADHLSYAAYGRMVTTGHNPYTTTPAALARLGDPVARAVQDWRDSPSVYGSLATGLQALASWIGGTSARLTVFVLSLLNAGRVRRHRAAAAPADPRQPGPPAPGRAAVGRQPAAAPGAGGRRARRQPGDRVRHRRRRHFCMIFKGYGSGGPGPVATPGPSARGARLRLVQG